MMFSPQVLLLLEPLVCFCNNWNIFSGLPLAAAPGYASVLLLLNTPGLYSCWNLSSGLPLVVAPGSASVLLLFPTLKFCNYWNISSGLPLATAPGSASVRLFLAPGSTSSLLYSVSDDSSPDPSLLKLCSMTGLSLVALGSASVFCFSSS